MEVDFEDKEGGMGLRNHEVGVFTSEDGELHYERTTCEAVLSDDSGSEAAVGYLAQFCTNPDTEKLSEWVADNICFTDIFDNWAPDVKHFSCGFLLFSHKGNRGSIRNKWKAGKPADNRAV